MDTKATLAALLGSRICHDLISPLGAIGNGIELLELSGIDSPEVALIREAVADANRRIKLFRIPPDVFTHTAVNFILGLCSFGHFIRIASVKG